MTDEYTPEIKALAVWLSQEVDDEPMWSCVVIAKRFAASDWLAAHDAEIRAERDSLARLHEVATERTVQLAAVIEKAREWRSIYANGGDTSLANLGALFASADTDAALREVRAKAWDEGYDFRSTLPPYHIGGPSENPYGEGA